jgi:hypothetical protein
LLLEAPMSVPVPDGQPDAWRTLGTARNGEGDRPWPAGAGAAALATGLAAGCMDAAPACRRGAGAGSENRPGSWRHGGAQLLLTEAFITAAGKPGPLPAGQDAADAAAAALALAGTLDGSAPLPSSVRCAPQEPFNLPVAKAQWAGLRIDPAQLHAEVLVVAARREPWAPRS